MNALAVMSLLQATLQAAQEIQQLLQKAQMENRDVTDEEVKALKLGNDTLSQDLIARLHP